MYFHGKKRPVTVAMADREYVFGENYHKIFLRILYLVLEYNHFYNRMTLWFASLNHVLKIKYIVPKTDRQRQQQYLL